MLVKVTDKNLDVGIALPMAIEARLRQLAERDFEGAMSAHVTISGELGEGEEPGDLNPVIIAETPGTELSVS